MLFETIAQPRIFLWMLAAGMLVGAWYGALAGLRRLLAAGVWLGLVCDMLFGLGAAAIFCGGLYLANYAALRLYHLLAAGLGFMAFALGAYPPGRRAVYVMKCAAKRIFVTFSRFRWIKVIFK